MIEPLQKFKLFKYWGYKAGAMQWLAHCADTPFVMVRGGNRSGKTMLAGMECACHMQIPNQSIWDVAPTYDLADKVFRLVKKYGVEGIGKRGWAKVLDRNNPQEIQISNGTHVWAKSTERKKSLEGEGVNVMVIDEFGFMDELTWKRLVMRLDQDNSRCIIIFTPKGKSVWIREFWNEKMSDPDWTCIHMPTDEVEYANKHFLEMAERELGGKSSPAYKEQVRGEFVAYGLLVYPMFTQKNIGKRPIHKGEKFSIGADSGYVHPCHASFWAISPQDDCYKMAEYHKSFMTRKENADGIAEKAKVIIKIHPQIERFEECRYDPSDPAFAKELKRVLSPMGTKVLPANNDVEAGIELERKMLPTQILINPECKNTIFSYQNYAHKENSEDVQKINDDPCDADRYTLLSHFGKPKSRATYQVY